MQLQGKALRVSVYFGESDVYQGKTLHMALLQFLKKEGASGATIVRGLAGFGARSRIHTASIVDLSSDLPLKLEWIDEPDLVERLMPDIRKMVNDGLITVEEIDVIQYAPGRRPDPLAQPVQELMRRRVVTVKPETPLAEVVTLLLQKGYRSLPVVDDQHRPIGIITDGDLLHRTDISTRLSLPGEPADANQELELAALRAKGQTAGDLMTTPVITVLVTAPLRDAVDKMVKHDLKRLPVVTDTGQLIGWISRIDVLRALEYHQMAQESETEAPLTGATIADMMYRDVPVVLPGATLEETVQALEKNRRRRVVVIDEERRVLGILTDGDLLERVQNQLQPGLLKRLRALVTGIPPAAPVSLAESKDTAADLMTAPVITIPVDASPSAALSLMIKHEIKRLPVVDQNGRLVGLLGRASLLRGLVDTGDPEQATTDK